MENHKNVLRPGIVAKFFLISLIGILIFLVPVRSGETSTTLVSILISKVGEMLSGSVRYIATVLIAFSAFGSLYDYICTKRGVEGNRWIHEHLATTPVYIISKFLTLVFVIMYYFGLGSERFIAVSGDMVSLCGTLVSLAISLSFLLVFLTDGGLMEFVGVLMKPFVRPLFTVPSEATMDLLASWIGASDAAVILTQAKYRAGYYNKREAGCIMCNFSLVSISFCLVIAQIAGVEQYFSIMYPLLAVLGMILACILPRIYPLNKLPDVYIAKKIDPPQEEEQHHNIFYRALHYGCAVAEKFDWKLVLRNGLNTFFSVLLNVMPIAIGWGVLGMFLIEWTPLMNWISLPMKWYLTLLGVEEAAAVAPATLVGFIDMYIPALLITEVVSVKTRFIIATLSLIQIVYITIVGAVVMQSKIGLNPLKLFVIYLERTLIALPLIVLATNLFIG